MGVAVEGITVGDADGPAVGATEGENVGGDSVKAVGARVGDPVMHSTNHCAGASGLTRTHSAPALHATPTHGLHVSHRTGHDVETPPIAHAPPDEFSALTRSGQNDASAVPLHPGSGVGVG